MKNLLLMAVVMVFGFTNLCAQDDVDRSSKFDFGMKAGYTSTILKVKVDGISASDDVSGFYFGLFGDMMISEKFGLHPELLYSTYSQDGENTGVLQLPILVNYKPNERFSILAGPQLDFLLNEEDAAGLKQLGLGVALGAAYDITDDVIIDARYSFGLSDRLDGDLEGFEAFDVETKFNYFFVGLGYRF